MKVFGIPVSPFVRKVHLVAALKGVPVEVAPANPRDPSPEFSRASPFHKIPALQHGDFALADSTAIVTYIDALHPAPAIFPAQPQARGKAIWWEEFADTILTPAAGKVVFNRFVGPRLLGLPGDEAAAAEGEAEVRKLIAWLEGEVPAEGWLAGELSIADLSLASVLRTLGYAGLEPDPADCPRVCAWYDRVRALPCWQQVARGETAITATFG